MACRSAFASSLLIPEHLLLRELKEEGFDIDDTDAIERLALRFKVSQQAMTFRLVNREQ